MLARMPRPLKAGSRVQDEPLIRAVRGADYTREPEPPLTASRGLTGGDFVKIS